MLDRDWFVEVEPSASQATVRLSDTNYASEAGSSLLATLCASGLLAGGCFILPRENPTAPPTLTDAAMPGVDLGSGRGALEAGTPTLLDGAPRSAQARAAEDCVLASLSRADFTNLIETQAGIASKIAYQLARELGQRVRDGLLTAERPAL